MAYSADTFVADEQPTTAKWNKLWSNDASFNDGTGIGDNAIDSRHYVDNSIDPEHLATNAIFLGTSTKTDSNFTTSSATPVQVTGATLTVTVPSGGRAVIIFFNGRSMYSSTTNFPGASLWKGTVGSGTLLAKQYGQGPGDMPITLIGYDAAPTAGSTTYNLGLEVISGGTASLSFDSTAPRLTAIFV